MPFQRTRTRIARGDRILFSEFAIYLEIVKQDEIVAGEEEEDIDKLLPMYETDELNELVSTN